MKNPDREEKLAQALDEEGLLAPLLAVAAAQVADEARDAVLADPPLSDHGGLVHNYPGLTEDQYLLLASMV